MELLSRSDLRDWVLTLKNLVFPQFCKSCHMPLLTEENPFFCPTCWELSPRIERPFCTQCGKPHAGLVGFGMPGNYPCAQCRENPNPYLQHIFGAACYEGPVKETIKLLKFQSRPWAARPLAELMCIFAEQEMDPMGYDRIVPVPLHAVRYRDRGFNQSLLLARQIEKSFPNATLDVKSLRRIRPTRIQSRLSATERRHNLAGAFAVRGEKIAGQRVLLVDDVITTGGTVTECAATLHAAGAVQVDAFAAALAVPRSL